MEDPMLKNTMSLGRKPLSEQVADILIEEVKSGKLNPGDRVPSETELGERLGVFVSDRKKLALDLCEIRSIIEPWIVRKAAENATEEDIRQMEKLCCDVEAMIAKGKNHSDPDIKLHKLWAECTGNSVAPNLIPVLLQSIPLFIDVTGGALTEPTITTHRRITDAIRRHDPAAAEEAMRDHIAFNRQAIERLPVQDF